jgi:threonine/homoserine/homoserine lactone efflux protein
MKKLPKSWWCFLPIWLFFPTFLGVFVVIGRVNRWLGFFVACLCMLLNMLAYIPMRRNQMSARETLLWVGAGTVALGIPGVVLIYAVIHAVLGKH